jgi:predicted DNA-binding transcriptional regulator YafY
MPVASAVLQREQPDIVHHRRSRDDTLSREILPQLLTHLRENWYVDTFCNLRKELRSMTTSASPSATLATNNSFCRQHFKHQLLSFTNYQC